MTVKDCIMLFRKPERFENVLLTSEAALPKALSVACKILLSV